MSSEIEFVTEVQKSPSPVENALLTTAATGISTITAQVRSIDTLTRALARPAEAPAGAA